MIIYNIQIDYNCKVYGLYECWFLKYFWHVLSIAYVYMFSVIAADDMIINVRAVT